MNTVLSPIVQGTHKMLEGQTMDMQQYREQKDRLEREAMLRNPETAYLVSDEEFDRQAGRARMVARCHGNPHGHVYGSGHVQSGKEYP